MNHPLSDALKRELNMAQALFRFASEAFTDPLRQLCGLLDEDWLSCPSTRNQEAMVTIIEICLPHLEDQFKGEYQSTDLRHQPFQQIQMVLIALKSSAHSSALNNYLNLANALLNVMMVMDAQYKAQITHVDELEHAKEIAHTAESYAKRHGVKIVITILDKSAQLVLLYRMHGTILISTDVALEKARSAILMRMPSGAIRPLVQPGAEFEGLLAAKPGLCVLDGGFPMYAGSRLIGAIGISGSTAALDIEIAQHAVRENYLSITPENS